MNDHAIRDGGTSYDQMGQLVETTRLNANGDPVSATRRELDRLGRTIKVSQVDYQGGKAGPPRWLLRLEYGGEQTAPTVVARPSVAPGRELQTRIAYNLAGQPVSVTDTGWVPTYDGKQAAAPITRTTTTYRHATINGHSLLTRIDGPLPNGKSNSPLDSDITVIEYDRRPDGAVDKKTDARKGKLECDDGRVGKRKGLLTCVIASGNLVTEVLATRR